VGASRIQFSYVDRPALLAAGWDFLARTPTGAPRNTEQTAGRVVSYDQSVHPGVLRIPADAGTLWAASNNTRNMLFRDLPPDWTSIRLGVAAFAPTTNYQGVFLLAYQDDDNYVVLGRDFSNGQLVEWWHETADAPMTVVKRPTTETANLALRLDRDPPPTRLPPSCRRREARPGFPLAAASSTAWSIPASASGSVATSRRPSSRRPTSRSSRSCSEAGST
jgi:hypothetical protein